MAVSSQQSVECVVFTNVFTTTRERLIANYRFYCSGGGVVEKNNSQFPVVSYKRITIVLTPLY